MKFKVQTLDHAGLKRAAQNLLALAQEQFEPNLIIGIRTGGYDVAALMAANAPLLPIKCQRPGTAKKNKSSTLKAVLKNLPYPVSNQLRIAEHIYLTQVKKPKPKTGYVPNEQEYTDIKTALEKLDRDARVLIVDDSLDTGATMQVVNNLVQNAAHDNATIKTGVITLTTEDPLIQPDFKLYDLTLCRFPWSFDFRESA